MPEQQTPGQPADRLVSFQPPVLPDDGGHTGDSQDQGGNTQTSDQQAGDAQTSSGSGTDWRAEARKWEQRAKDNKTAADELAKLKAEQMTAEQRALAQADEYQQRARTAIARAVRSEVRALAAPEFADPDDAAAFLNTADYVDETTGEIDTPRITHDLTELLQRKPHLARQADEGQQQRRGPRPDPTQASGARNTPSGDPAQQFAAILRAQMMGRAT